MRRTHHLVLALALAATACGGGKEAPSAQRSDAGETSAETPSGKGVSLARVAVLGASVSAGFLVPGVAALLESGISGTHRIENCADWYMFRDPVTRGRAQVERALSSEPTVVFAIDFLFWYAYGGGLTLADREAQLAAGMHELERLDVPVLVGDLPDMSGASERMLAPEQIPPSEELAVLNRSIRAWAVPRPEVVLLPLAEWVAPLRGHTPIVAEEGQPPVNPAALMNIDGLHPNADGMRYLLRKVDALIEERYPGTKRENLVLR